MLKLILKEDSWSSANAFYLEGLYKKHFELTTDINSDGLIYVDWRDYDWANDLNRPGIVDHLWDPKEQHSRIQDTDKLLVMRSDGWFDIANEPLWYKAAGLDKFTASNKNNKTFLMLMSRQRFHRELIWNMIQPILTNAVYSYHGRGVPLQGGNDINPSDGNWERYVDPAWYNSTKFSLVVESGIASNSDNTPVDPSEKALKPFAFKHPMIVWGPPLTLSWLRSWGFETFDNCIDESYDLEFDTYKRLTKVVKEVERLCNTPSDYFVTEETQRRLDVNYNRFYDLDWAHLQLEEKLFNVIKAYGTQHGQDI